MILIFAVFNDPVSVPAKNERIVINLLRGARPVIRGCCVESINMADNLVLLPNAPIKVSGFQYEVRSVGTGYSITAEPIERWITGFRSFYVDQTRVIRWEVNKVATAESRSFDTGR